MKYTILRQNSIKNRKFEIISDSKTVYTVKATLPKEHKNQHNIKLSNPINKHVDDDWCTVVPDPKQSQKYFIYVKNKEAEEKALFGQLSYKIQAYNNYLYEITIDEKVYEVQSSDLKDRLLTIVDATQSTNTSTSYYPKTLLQATDSISKSNEKYRLAINDTKWQLGYLAIATLLGLHEYERNTI